MDINVKKDKSKYNDWTLTFKHMTNGKIMAIQRALQLYGETSPVCKDVSEALDAILEQTVEFPD